MVIDPQFYKDIAQNIAFSHVNYTYLSWFDRLFISFWIVISVYTFTGFWKIKFKELYDDWKKKKNE